MKEVVSAVKLMVSDYIGKFKHPKYSHSIPELKPNNEAFLKNIFYIFEHFLILFYFQMSTNSVFPTIYREIVSNNNHFKTINNTCESLISNHTGPDSFLKNFS